MDFTSEQRSQARRPCNEAVKIVIAEESPGAPTSPITATVVDISSTGMGVSLNFSLKKGQTIAFEKNQPNWDLPSKGLVVWSYIQNSRCRAGLEFIL